MEESLTRRMPGHAATVDQFFCGGTNPNVVQRRHSLSAIELGEETLTESELTGPDSRGGGWGRLRLASKTTDREGRKGRRDDQDGEESVRQTVGSDQWASGQLKKKVRA